MSGLFEHLAANDDSERIAGRQAAAVANKRVKDQLGEFLGNATDQADLDSRMELVTDDITRIATEVGEEYGVVAERVESVIRDRYAKLATCDCGKEGCTCKPGECDCGSKTASCSDCGCETDGEDYCKSCSDKKTSSEENMPEWLEDHFEDKEDGKHDDDDEDEEDHEDKKKSSGASADTSDASEDGDDDDAVPFPASKKRKHKSAEEQKNIDEELENAPSAVGYGTMDGGMVEEPNNFLAAVPPRVRCEHCDGDDEFCENCAGAGWHYGEMGEPWEDDGQPHPDPNHEYEWHRYQAAKVASGGFSHFPPRPCAAKGCKEPSFFGTCRIHEGAEFEEKSPEEYEQEWLDLQANPNPPNPNLVGRDTHEAAAKRAITWWPSPCRVKGCKEYTASDFCTDHKDVKEGAFEPKDEEEWKSDFQRLFSNDHNNKEAAEAPSNSGGAVKREKLPKGNEDALGGPSPKIDKSKAGDEKGHKKRDIDTEYDNSPVPEWRVKQDVTTGRGDEEKGTSDYSHDSPELTSDVLTKEELPTANEDGQSTERNIDQPKTQTFPNKNQANPVTAALSVIAALDGFEVVPSTQEHAEYLQNCAGSPIMPDGKSPIDAAQKQGMPIYTVLQNGNPVAMFDNNMHPRGIDRNNLLVEDPNAQEVIDRSRPHVYDEPVDQPRPLISRNDPDRNPIRDIMEELDNDMSAVAEYERTASMTDPACACNGNCDGSCQR